MKLTPLQRVGYIGDVANLTLFLFSEAANFISGEVIVVDGAAEHLRHPGIQLSYPESVLDPERALASLKSKL